MYWQIKNKLYFSDEINYGADNKNKNIMQKPIYTITYRI